MCVYVDIHVHYMSYVYIYLSSYIYMYIYMCVHISVYMHICMYIQYIHTAGFISKPAFLRPYVLETRQRLCSTP